ncbi:MAG: response regulator [Candidatus Omnitrophica bacterium]|nr:response regulator [Candidatus Omnitrophota bacterium]
MRRILLVEDEKEILKAVGKFLEKEGFSVTAASSGREAVEKLRAAKKPDLGLFDVKMPGMSGFDCLKEIRKNIPGLPALFLTGSIDIKKHKKVLGELGIGMDDVLQKPVDLYLLLEKIKSRIEARKKGGDHGREDTGRGRRKGGPGRARGVPEKEGL